MLHKEGAYYYGTCGKDIWAALEIFTAGDFPVFAYRFAVCVCGQTIFNVWLDEEAGYVVRVCVKCGHDHVMIDSQETADQADDDKCECLCGGEEFEVMGAVSPFFDNDPDGARTFYLGLRCVECGCTGCYGSWNVRWANYRDWIDRV
jgi:hypothetical protein